MLDLSKCALVTHRNCLDGSATAILFRICGGLEENIHFVNPNNDEVDEKVSELLERWEGSLFIVDVSVSLKLAKEIKRSDIFLFDHHASAKQLSGLSWCEIEINNSCCGSLMFYNWLCSNGFCFVEDDKNLLSAVDSADRWTWEDLNTENISILHEVLGQKKFIQRFVDDSRIHLNFEERFVVDLEKEKRNEFVEQKKREAVVMNKIFSGKQVRVAFVLASSHQSILGSEICSDLDLDVEVCVMVGPTSVSLRSRKSSNINLAEVASNVGGGGHMSAAGVSLNKLLGKSLLELVMDKL